MDSGSLFRFPLHCDSGILEHFLYSHGPIFMILGKMTDGDKRMNPLHFGSDLADIQIWIRINPEVRIQISDHFWLRFWRWWRFSISEHSLVIIVTVIVIITIIIIIYIIINTIITCFNTVIYWQMSTVK